MICVIGPAGAGKTTIASYLSRVYGLIHVEASEYMIGRYFDARSRAAMLRFVLRTFRQQGMDVIARDVIAALKRNRWPADRIVVSGFRTPEELALVSKTIGPLIVLGVDAPTEVRFARSKLRYRAWGPPNYAQFLIKDMHEWTWGLGQMMEANARCTLRNDGTFEQLFDAVDAWARRIGRVRQRSAEKIRARGGRAR